MGGGVCAAYRGNVKEMELGNLGGGFQVEKTAEWGGGEQEVMLVYGVRSLHCVSNRSARVGEHMSPSAQFFPNKKKGPGEDPFPVSSVKI